MRDRTPRLPVGYDCGLIAIPLQQLGHIKERRRRPCGQTSEQKEADHRHQRLRDVDRVFFLEADFLATFFLVTFFFSEAFFFVTFFFAGAFFLVTFFFAGVFFAGIFFFAGDFF
ncbi:MAG TPA: hypothetical protein DEO92_00050, partial [Phycisphaerales bacterium]|nr:hypothetical protein [Phycisphaerales bacterium]